MAQIGERELKNLRLEISAVEDENTRWLRERRRLEDEHRLLMGEVDNIDNRMEMLHLSNTSLDDRELRRKNREQVRIEGEMRHSEITARRQSSASAGLQISATGATLEMPDAARRQNSEGDGMQFGATGTITRMLDTPQMESKLTRSHDRRRDSVDMYMEEGQHSTLTPHVLPERRTSISEGIEEEDKLSRVSTRSIASRLKIPVDTTPFLPDGLSNRTQEIEKPAPDHHRQLFDDRTTEEKSFLRKQELTEMEKRANDRVLFIKNKEREMELERQMLVEEEQLRVQKLHAIELKQKQMEEEIIRERILRREKEDEFALERRRMAEEDRIRLARLKEAERKCQQIQEEDRKREERIKEMKLQECRNESSIRERLLADEEQKERIQRLVIEERRREDELSRMEAQIRHDRTEIQEDRLMDWEREVNEEQQRRPEIDRLTLLFETEKRIARAIQEELQKKERHNTEQTEYVPKQSNRARIDDHNPPSNTDPTTSKQQEKIYLKPTLSTCSGMEPVPRNESSFEIWLLEVECLMRTYPDYLVSQAIRHSLRGEAKRVLLPLGPLASAQDIVGKMESVFGNVVSGESVLQQFYSTRQKETETVTSWGLRLEEILQKAITKGHIQAAQRNEMLRIKFWRGLFSDELRNATRMYFETEWDFEALRKKVRAEEFEIGNHRKENQHRQIEDDLRSRDKIHQTQMQMNKERNMFAELVARMERMEKKMDEMNRPRNQSWYSKKKKPNQNPNDADRKEQEKVPEQQSKKAKASLN